MKRLEIKNLHVSASGNEILKGINLIIKPGDVHALMGPNGSGKSTLANTLMGHPKYKITKGKILLDGNDITNLSPDKRAKLGLFLSFQYASEIPGLTVSRFLRTALNSVKNTQMAVIDFYRLLQEKMAKLKIDKKFGTRYLNHGFSGGEKKKIEILQMLILNPKYAVLDETDSGLDVDALRVVADGINSLNKSNDRGLLLITHYNRILKYVKPNRVHILSQGKIILSGGEKLAKQIEREGYDKIIE